jgi:hypothetical protein
MGRAGIDAVDGFAVVAVAVFQYAVAAPQSVATTVGPVRAAARPHSGDRSVGLMPWFRWC